MTYKVNKETEDQIEQFKKMSYSAKKTIELLNTKYDKTNVQHTVLMVSLARAIQYFDAYLDLVEKGFVEPSATLLRSIYHTLIWMRWSVLNMNNANIYFNIGLEEMKKMLKALQSRDILDFKNAPDPEKVKRLLKEITDKIDMPHISDMVKDIGYGDTHAMIYPTLAAISHGSLMLVNNNKKFSYIPEGTDIEKYFEVANNLFRDCVLVCEEFIKDGTIRKVPDIKKLSGIKS